MRDAVLAAFDDADAVVMAAAVADFRPKAIADGKLKKDAGRSRADLEPTPDILAELGERRKDQVLVGFAAETERTRSGGPGEARGKRLDLVVVNEVGRAGTGFGSDTNDAMLLGANGETCRSARGPSESSPRP